MHPSSSNNIAVHHDDNLSMDLAIRSLASRSMSSESSSTVV